MSPAMRSLWQQHGLTALLGLAALAGLIALAVETSWGKAIRLSLPVANAPARTGDMVATLPGFSLPPLDSAFRESGERPLFSSTRRPAAVNTASAPAMKKGQFRLSGTSVSADLTVAFLLEAATGKTVRVAKGKEINGMTLDTVEANRAVLKLGDETEELTLRTAASPPVRAAPPVQSGAPVPSGPAVPVPASIADAAPQPPRQVVPQSPGSPNPPVPAPGFSQLPGFVMQPAPAAQTQAAPSTESPGQRRRRNPAAPQQ